MSVLAQLRTLALPVAVVLATFTGMTVVGYVYSHEPARADLVIQFEGTPVPGAEYMTGAAETFDGGTLRLAVGAGGRRDIQVPPGTPIEALERLDGLLPGGARVNVGVDNTSFGQVLTGVVAVEDDR